SATCRATLIIVLQLELVTPALCYSRRSPTYRDTNRRASCPLFGSIQLSATDPRSHLHDRRQGRIVRCHLRPTIYSVSGYEPRYARQSKSCSMGGNGCP